MTDAYTQVIDDLAAEHAALRAVLERVPFPDWERPTHAPGWAIRDQVAHLTFFDRAALTAIRDPEAFEEGAARTLRDGAAGGDPPYIGEARAKSAEEVFRDWLATSAELVAAARTLDPERRMPWYGNWMAATSFITARLMECWSHGLDIVDVADVERPASDRLRHVAYLGVRTRSFSYLTRGLEPNTDPVRVELVAPSGNLWSFGDPAAEQWIRGPAEDFCMVVTQRRHMEDTRLEVHGPAAAEWMRYAQAFAGPPGQGRQPGQFPRAHP